MRCTFADTADKIDPRTVRVEVLNDTNGARLKWAEPTITNGLILTYVIQYKRMDFENVSVRVSAMVFMKW